MPGNPGSGSRFVNLLTDDVQHLGVNPQITGDDVAILEIALITSEVGGDAAGLLHQ